jgi:ATP-dependent Clp protease adaptor protein ClpS
MPQATKPKEHVVSRDATAVKRPPLYKVFLLNDNYTTMEFVVMVLETIFGKDHQSAERIMLSVHRQGMGVAGVYVRDIAEMKCDAVHKLAKSHGFPLHCDIEPE